MGDYDDEDDDWLVHNSQDVDYGTMLRGAGVILLIVTLAFVPAMYVLIWCIEYLWDFVHYVVPSAPS